jgi:hypothetical protein
VSPQEAILWASVNEASTEGLFLQRDRFLGPVLRTLTSDPEHEDGQGVGWL